MPQINLQSVQHPDTLDTLMRCIWQSFCCTSLLWFSVGLYTTIKNKHASYYMSAAWVWCISWSGFRRDSFMFLPVVSELLRHSSCIFHQHKHVLYPLCSILKNYTNLTGFWGQKNLWVSFKCNIFRWCQLNNKLGLYSTNLSWSSSKNKTKTKKPHKRWVNVMPYSIILCCSINITVSKHEHWLSLEPRNSWFTLVTLVEMGPNKSNLTHKCMFSEAKTFKGVSVWLEKLT